MTLVQRRLLGLTLTLIVGGSAAGLAWWQFHHSQEQQKTEETSAKVLSFSDPALIREVALKTPAGAFTMEREGTAAGGNDWMIVTPVRTKADGATVSALLNELAQLKRKSNPGATTHDNGIAGDRKLFGLDPPRFRVTVSDSQGKQETLTAGIKNSFDGSLYVEREGSPKVLMVLAAIEYQLDQNLFKLRDKRLLNFLPSEVLKLEAAVADKTRYALEHVDEQHWRLTSPRAVAADTDAVAAIVTELGNVVATAFVSEGASPDDLKRTGLDKPALTLILTLRQGAPRRLLFSEVSGKDGKKRYATLGSGNPIIEIASNAVLEKVLVDAETLRDLHVLTFAREQVGTLEISSGNTSLAFKRSGESGGDVWSMTAPATAKAQDATVTGLVYRLWNLKAKRIVLEAAKPADLSRLGLAKPSLRVTVKSPDGAALGTILFGNVEGEDQYVMRADGTRVDTVPVSVSRAIALDPTAYQEAAAAQK